MTTSTMRLDSATRTFRRPRQEFWENRWTTSARVRRMIEGLDPVEDDAEITHLSLEVIVPGILAHAAYASGTARGMIHPAEAKVGYRDGTGEQLVAPTHRDRDTLTFFGLFMREGHRSARSQAIFDRVQQIHHDVRGVGNDLQMHILGLLMIEPERWVRDLGVSDFFGEIERQARFSFWKGVGQGMGLRGIWDSYEHVEPWVLDFEAKHFSPSFEASELYKGQVKGFEAWFPGPTRAIAADVLGTGLSDMTRRAVGARPQRRGFKAALHAVIKAEHLTSAVRPVNLSSTWVGSFSRDGQNPDLDRIGYQHDMAHDPRYRRTGDPQDGYTFSVEHGVRSRRAEQA